MNLSKVARVLQSVILVFSPLYIVRFGIDLPFLSFPLPTTLLEIVLLVTIAITFLDFLKDGAKWSNLRTKFDPLIALFLLTAIISITVSFNKIGGLGILRAYFIEPVLFFYCLVYTAKKFGYDFIIHSLLISGLWLSLMGILQKVTGSFTFAPHEIAQGRISAVYNSANSLAMYIGPLVLLSLSKFLTETQKKKILYLLLFLFFTLTLILTRSRGGMVAEAGALAIFIYTIFTLRNSILKKIWYLAPIICLFLISLFFYQLYLSYNFLPYANNRPYTEGDTLQIRYFIWTGTVNMLRDNPISGAGLNGFKTLYTNAYRLPQYQEEFQYPHNLILTFWTETGIYGLFAFLLLIVSSFSLIIRNVFSNKDPILGAALLAILSYIILHGMVDVPYFKNDLSIQFWALIALVYLWYEKGRA